MISVYKIKPGFQKLLSPVLMGLNKAGVTANQLTVSAIFLSAGLGLLLFYHPGYRYFLLLVALGLLLRMALNALDGMMATRFNMQSKLGEILNELGDILSDSFIIFSLVILPSVDPRVIILFGILAIINEFAGILAKAVSGVRRYDGPMGKSDRALLLGVFCIGLYFWPGLEVYSNWIFLGASALVIFSTFTRLRKALDTGKSL